MDRSTDSGIWSKPLAQLRHGSDSNGFVNRRSGSLILPAGSRFRKYQKRE